MNRTRDTTDAARNHEVASNVRQLLAVRNEKKKPSVAIEGAELAPSLFESYQARCPEVACG